VDGTVAGETLTIESGVTPGERKRLVVLAALCVPGAVAAATLALDHATTRVLRSALTTWGFIGGVIGLAAFLCGFVSILTWPGVVLLGARSFRIPGLTWPSRGVILAGCVVATYSALYFAIWFIIIPLRAW
jgi:hypothetical protein